MDELREEDFREQNIEEWVITKCGEWREHFESN
mgnify:CR=1 FL=1